MKLLLVEDNRELSSWLTRLLDQSGYAVEQAFTGDQADTLLRTQTYDAILLDLTLPVLNGQTLLRRLRAQDNSVPVLIISAQDSLQDIVEHLNLGADDYLAKPFDIQELEARLRSLLRRASGKGNPVYTCSELSFDSNSKIFRSHGRELNLTPREHAVLETLIARAGSAVSKEKLFGEVFSLGDEANIDAIDLYIHRVRKKLDSTAPDAAVITTLRGIGYVLQPRPAA